MIAFLLTIFIVFFPSIILSRILTAVTSNWSQLIQTVGALCWKLKYLPFDCFLDFSLVSFQNSGACCVLMVHHQHHHHHSVDHLAIRYWYFLELESSSFLVQIIFRMRLFDSLLLKVCMDRPCGRKKTISPSGRPSKDISWWHCWRWVQPSVLRLMATVSFAKPVADREWMLILVQK